MSKILQALVFVVSFSLVTPCFAYVQPSLLVDGNENGYSVGPARSAVSITDNASTHTTCRAVWVGTAQSIDLYVGGAWITFQGATAGSIIPVNAKGARITSGSASPAAGDIVFLY